MESAFSNSLGASTSTASSIQAEELCHFSSNTGTSFKELTTTSPLTLRGPNNSPYFAHNTHKNEFENPSAESHSEWESRENTNQRNIERDEGQYQQQQLEEDTVDFSDFYSHQKKTAADFKIQELRRKVESLRRHKLKEREKNKMLLLELKLAREELDEVELLNPTYSDLMKENQELKKRNNDFHTKLKESSNQLQTLQSEKEFWRNKVAEREEENNTLYKNKLELELRLSIEKRKFRVADDEVMKLFDKNSKIEVEAKIIESQLDAKLNEAKMEVKELKNKIEKKEEELKVKEEEYQKMMSNMNYVNLQKRGFKENEKMDTKEKRTRLSSIQMDVNWMGQMLVGELKNTRVGMEQLESKADEKSGVAEVVTVDVDPHTWNYEGPRGVAMTSDELSDLDE